MFKLMISRRLIRNAFILIILIMVPFYLFMYLQYTPPNMKLNSPGDGYSIKTAGCSMPSLNPFDPLILPLIFKNAPLKCSKNPPLIKSDLHTLHVQIPVLSAYNVTNLSHFHCCYQEVQKKKYPTDAMYKELSNDAVIFSEPCVRFTTKAKITVEFVRVICENNGEEIYRDYHSFVPFKKSGTNKPSVLVIGIDSVSRVNLHRQMSMTTKTLRELHAFEFLGYNKVGDNTFPNLIPALTGKSEFELYDDCLTSKYLFLPTKFDSCEFIWKNYSRAGFLTAYAEDASYMALFNFKNKYGFKQQPTDYYWGLFNYASEIELGHNPYNSTNIPVCMGPRRIYQDLILYMKKLMYTLRNNSYFAWFWECSLTHAHFNFPSIGDADYRNLFLELNKTNILNNTIVIFLSDHGRNYGKIMLTHQGFLESRLPFLYVLVPNWFKQLYPTAVKNLDTNTRRLITAFDIHEMLNDLVNIEDLTTDKLQKRTNELHDNRGISLFLPIPETRTCESAGIPLHYCTCFQSVPVKITDEDIVNVANFIVNYINVKLDAYDACAKLSLDSIISARLLISKEFRDNFIIMDRKSVLYNYIVTIQTIPGNGIFDSTVRRVKFDHDHNFEIQGSISRLNTYGNTSDCINNSNLLKYCYCNK